MLLVWGLSVLRLWERERDSQEKSVKVRSSLAEKKGVKAVFHAHPPEEKVQGGYRTRQEGLHITLADPEGSRKCCMRWDLKKRKKKPKLRYDFADLEQWREMNGYHCWHLSTMQWFFLRYFRRCKKPVTIRHTFSAFGGRSSEFLPENTAKRQAGSHQSLTHSLTILFMCVWAECVNRVCASSASSSPCEKILSKHQFSPVFSIHLKHKALFPICFRFFFFYLSINQTSEFL